ncbi:AAA family ATPase [Achromobacter anxifer]|uniref:AAA family ATPase n=1 Tax=Achromobacter anxifer TaxID=1287737 RepID=UPI0015902CA7|nr:AAA family ATPase [Achromobacter anxifer]
MLADANMALLMRYDALLASHGATPTPSEVGTDDNHLRWMCETAIANIHGWPVDKVSRWLGFIQGVLTVSGRLTTASEREFSRPLFHAAYQAEGRQPPASIGPETEPTKGAQVQDPFAGVRLVLIRGLPGSGKSTLAKEIARSCGFLHFENDMFFESEAGYAYDPETQPKASGWCIKNVSDALLSGSKVVVSNVFLEPRFMQVYMDMEPNFLVVECNGDFGSIHSIPPERIQEMRRQWVPYPGAMQMA